jgi:hypothetical protein
MNQLKVDRLRALGFTGTFNDMEVAYFKSKGLTQTTYNDLKSAYWRVTRSGGGLTIEEAIYTSLGTLGYTGPLQQRELAALTANTYYV